jgi:hypothetical protein
MQQQQQQGVVGVAIVQHSHGSNSSDGALEGNTHYTLTTAMHDAGLV